MAVRRKPTARARKRRRAARPKPPPAPRRDDTGHEWTLAEVEREIASILSKLAPGWDPAAIRRSTRIHEDLGFDTWGILRVVRPVRDRLHETLSDALVRELRKVGDLVDYVWAKMEDA
jgi:acyl carrier protein